jgi:hypothetical protein
VEFLSAERPDLRTKAVEAILSLTASLDGRIELNAAEAPKALCSLVRGDENSKSVISALVNLSADTDRVALDQMLSCGILDDITEILFSPRKEEVAFQDHALMLLSNLTVSKEGANDVVENANEEVRELLILKLLHLSLESAPATEQDPMAYASYVVANLTQLEQGRLLLMDSAPQPGAAASSGDSELAALQAQLAVLEAGGSSEPPAAPADASADAPASRLVMKQLLQLDSANEIRRRGTAAAIRNCCLVPELRDQLIAEVGFACFHVLLCVASPCLFFVAGWLHPSFVVFVDGSRAFRRGGYGGNGPAGLFSRGE